MGQRVAEEVSVWNEFRLCSELTMKVVMHFQLFQDGVRFQEDRNERGTGNSRKNLRRPLSFKFFNSFKPKLVKIIFKNLVLTSKKTQCVFQNRC
jgi:hypothetical protein